MSNIEEVLPLAPLQEGLLFHSGLDGDDVYTVQTVVDLDGPLDVARLRTAAEALVARHAVLRAAFVADPAGAVQVVLRRVSVPWTEVELGESEVDAALAADRATPFVMDNPPLIRFLLIRTGATHRLVISSHHILLDGWSAPLLLSDLFALYAGTPLPPPRPFREFLAWLAKRDRAASLDVWREVLAEITEPTLLVPVGDATTPRAGRVEVPIDVPQLRLAEFARAHGVTASTVIHAAWGITLARLTGRDDIVFGATVSGRPADLPGAETMVGLFINTVPVRVGIRSGEPVSELLARLHRAQTATLDHHHLNLAEVQALAGIGPLFDTLVVVESYPVDEEGIDQVRAALDVRVRAVDTEDATHYPLTLTAVPDEDLTLEFRADLLSPRACADIAARLADVLTEITADASRPVGRIGAESPAAQIAWNGDPVPLPELLAPDLVASQDPAAVAVVCDGTSLTFGALDALSGRLAAHLVSLGVGPESPVAVVLPRSTQVVVAMLAVWKAGGVVVPVDPNYPAARITAVLAEAAPVVAITARDDLGVPVVRPDARTWTGTGVAAGPSGPDSAAYIVFTSGSSGRPKGVIATHGGLANLALAHRAAVMDPLGRTVRVLNSLSFAFDGSIDSLTWMFAGHEMHVLPDRLMGDSVEIVDYVRSHRVDVVDVPPSLLELVVADGLLAGEHRPAVVATGAEAVGGGLWAELAGANARGLNLYGPTECTVDALWTSIEPGTAPHIGRPVANSTAYVLDSALNPVPTGVPGELYVGGAGLARGYVGRPDETAARFVANPFGSPGSRLYRTGDLVRLTSAGTVEFLGRVDDQVKIRGHRVEPGEVETALAGLPGVARAAVVARSGRLVGYVVADADGGALRDRLAEILPDHLVPTVIMRLDTFPTLPNGKLDRRSLPEPDFAATSTREPATLVEKTLCALFAEVLGLPNVGPDDSFLALGGHSLLAARLTARVRAELDVAIGVRTVLETPTPAGIAARLGQPDTGPAMGTLLPLRESGAAPPLFCVHPALGLGWRYAGLLPYLPDRPLFALQATEFTGRPTLREVAERYVTAITEAVPSGPVCLLGWSLGGVIAHAVACLLDREGREVRALVLLDSYPTGDGDPGGDTVPADLLAGLTERRAAQVADSLLTVSIVDRDGPVGTYRGDVTFVRASAGDDPPDWTPYVAGHMTTIEVDWPHEDLMTDAALRDVGPITAAALT
ncbi:Enterobactin synthetase component F, serine activating enzyme [Alloactinosynnema sp. L-07]|uniref:non-ribosomal peptide synthetase n=1 Tax=Alloactinosynnema sp. L-07 TaxID=1653480 RepID=UPI00065EFAB3|nr:non-ribosomal peptide synthetase [Alloactinosynnema sp. L-07]CRK56688.1 Enterobactin synthetase component F, serine activating enzyme [Alloactinosynnema sp. L-07]